MDAHEWRQVCSLQEFIRHDTTPEQLERLLLKHRVQDVVTGRGWAGWTVLHKAVTAKNLRLVQYLTQTWPALVNESTSSGWTPLMMLCALDTTADSVLCAMAQLLLTAGVDLQAKTTGSSYCLHSGLWPVGSSAMYAAWTMHHSSITCRRPRLLSMLQQRGAWYTAPKVSLTDAHFFLPGKVESKAPSSEAKPTDGDRTRLFVIKSPNWPGTYWLDRVARVSDADLASTRQQLQTEAQATDAAAGAVVETAASAEYKSGRNECERYWQCEEPMALDRALAWRQAVQERVERSRETKAIHQALQVNGGRDLSEQFWEEMYDDSALQEDAVPRQLPRVGPEFQASTLPANHHHSG